MWGSSRRGGLVALIISITLAVGASVPGRGADLVADPIGGMGHGELFDPSGRPINVTPSFIREAQEFYIRRLSAEADSATRKAFTPLRTLVLGPTLSDQARLVGNAELITWLIRRVRPADASALAAKNNFLRMLLRRRLSPVNQPVATDGPPFVLPEQAAVIFAKINEGAGLEGVAEPLSYEKECDRAGVPIPPDWGAKGWVRKGELTDEFESPNLKAEVFVFDSVSPQGLCIALPRSNATSIELLGIICSGKVSGKACFWDNQENDLNVDVPKDEIKPLAEFAGGAVLEDGAGGICTSCHRGENPFIIHPKTALGLPNLSGLKLKTDKWYKPLVAAAWPQNPGPGSFPAPADAAGDCAECHIQNKAGRLPSIDARYCVKVLIPAIERTMPPRSPGDSDYAVHAQVLKDACAAL